MLTIKYHSAFKKELRKILKRGYDEEKLKKVLSYLVNEQPLPIEYNDHNLKGPLKDYRECHIEPDWLLIYKIEKKELILSLARTGTHADLFDK